MDNAVNKSRFAQPFLQYNSSYRRTSVALSGFWCMSKDPRGFGEALPALETPPGSLRPASMTGPPPSGIRRFYGKIQSVGDRNEKYLCGLCSTVVSSSVAATSNLIKHMRVSELRIWTDVEEEHRKERKQNDSRFVIGSTRDISP